MGILRKIKKVVMPPQEAMPQPKEEIIDHPLFDKFLEWSKGMTDLNDYRELIEHWNFFLQFRPDKDIEKRGWSLLAPPKRVRL